MSYITSKGYAADTGFLAAAGYIGQRGFPALETESRYLLKFPAVDGAHALASSPVQLQAGDRVTVVAQMDGGGNAFRYLIDGASSSGRCYAIMSQDSRFVLQTGAQGDWTLDGVPIVDDSLTPDDGKLHELSIGIIANCNIGTVAARYTITDNLNQVFQSLKVERAGEVIHFFDFDVDNTTDTVVDQAGSAITFSLVNVLASSRQKVKWREDYNGWLYFEDDRALPYFDGDSQYASVGTILYTGDYSRNVSFIMPTLSGQFVRLWGKDGNFASRFLIDENGAANIRFSDSDLTGVDLPSGTFVAGETYKITVSRNASLGKVIVNSLDFDFVGVDTGVSTFEYIQRMNTSFGVGAIFDYTDSLGNKFPMDDLYSTNPTMHNDGTGPDGTYIDMTPDSWNVVEVAQGVNPFNDGELWYDSSPWRD